MTVSTFPSGGAPAAANPTTQGLSRGAALAAIAVTFTALMTSGGPRYFIAAVIITAVFSGLDLFAGSETSDPNYNRVTKFLMNAGLYLILPIMLWYGACYAWYLGAPGSDLLGIGRLVHALTGFDMQAARAHTTTPELLVGGYCVGTIWAGFGTTVGHELVHRTWSKPALLVGRWLMALTLDASFAIEHVYGHHNTLGTFQDPATARRGENVYKFIVRSTVGQVFGAWHIETSRLKRSGKRVHSIHNLMYRGWTMSAVYGAFFLAAAGIKGLLIYVAVALFGKCYLEAINYVEHYGIIRVPGEPVEPRHSWNCNHRVSSWLLFNLTRHSHHHAMGDKPYWDLRSYPDAPMMPYGYLTMIYLALVPPVFFRINNARVIDWDRTYAAPSEWELIETANRRSGCADLVGSTAHRAGRVPAMA